MTHPSFPNSSESSDMLESDRNQRDEAVRITALMENLNNLKSKLNHFTVMDELGQPIGEIQDLILDDTHQLNLVIAPKVATENNSSVLLNGRRIKKVSVQTHAVFVDIVKADVDFLPQYTPLESSGIPSESSDRPEFQSSASTSTQAPVDYGAAAAAALMGGSAIAHPAPEDTLSLEDDSFTSDSLFAEPADDFAALDDSFTSDSLFAEPTDDFAALDDSFTSDSLFAETTDDFAALEDDLFASDPLLPEPADDFATSVEGSSMESLDSLDDDWLSTDLSTEQNDLAASLELPELSEIELSPLENFSLEGESPAGFITNNSLDDDWSELVSPVDQPGLDYGTPSEDISLPDFSNNELETPAFSLETDETPEPTFALWEQASQDSFTDDSLIDVGLENELEDLPASSSFTDSFSVNTIPENADEFLLSADFGEAGSTTDLTLERLSDLDAASEDASLDDFGFPDTALTPLEPLEEGSLDDFGFPNRSTDDDLASELPSLDLNLDESLFDAEAPLEEISLDDFGFPDSSTAADNSVSELPDLDLNLGESLINADPGLSWVDETESDELFELNPNDSFDPLQPETGGDLELGLADELADLDLSLDSTDPGFDTDSTDLGFETNAIASLSNLDFSLDDNFSDGFVDQPIVDQPIVDPALSDMDLSGSEMPTSFVEVSVDEIAPSFSEEITSEPEPLSDLGWGSPENTLSADNLGDLELDTAFDVDLSLEDEFGADFAIAETNDLSEFTLQDDRVEPEPEPSDSLTAIEFANDLPTDDLSTGDLADTFGSVADLSFAEAGELEGLTNLGAELEAGNFALDSLFDNPVDNPESGSDEFNFSTSTMGFVDPAAGMAAASGILAGLAGLTDAGSHDRSPFPTEEIAPLDSTDINADISDMSNVPAQESLNLNNPAADLTVSEKPIVSGTFKSPKVANAVIDAIAQTLRHRCKSIRIEIELDDSSLTESYQAWLDECSDL